MYIDKYLCINYPLEGTKKRWKERERLEKEKTGE
jgi:hypothetical protein